jgi:Ca2+-dependent lipid-binding protein
LKVTLLDDCGDNNEPKVICEAVFEATSVYQDAGNMQERSIGKKGKLFMHIEESVKGNARGVFDLHLRGLDVKNVEPGPFGLGRSDPFFEVSKKNADYSIAQVKWNVIYRSESIDDNLNPYWKPAYIGLEELCYGKLDWPLKISVFDHNDNGKHTLIGEFETTIADLQERLSIKGNADREQAIPLGLESKYKTYGLLCVLEASVNDENLPV